MTEKTWPDRVFQGLTFERLESFLAVAEAGSIAKAAPGNPSRQSQLSRQLREVHEALGFEVLERSERGLQLTAEGQQLQTYLRELQLLLTHLRSVRSNALLPVTLAAGDSVLRWVVLPRLHEVILPSVELSLRAVTRGFTAVSNGEFDFAISRTRRKTDGMKTARIGTLRYALFASLSLRKQALSKEGIAALPFVYVTGAPEIMQTFEEQLGTAPRVALRCETFPQAAVALASGSYAAVLPTLAAKEFLPKTVFTIDLPGLSSLDLPLSLVARERRLEAIPSLANCYATLRKHLTEVLSG